MKYLLVIFFLLVSVSFNTQIKADTDEQTNKIKKQIKTSNLSDIDELINKSKATRKVADSLNIVSDRVVNKKVEKQIQVMTVLKYKVVELKQTNEVLKIKIDSLDNVGKSYQLLPISYDQDHW